MSNHILNIKKYLTCWQFVVIFFIGLLINATAENCSTGINTPGYTYPFGDILMKYGDDLQITCVLNVTINSTANSKYLFFSRNGEELDPAFTRIINDSAIELTVKKPPRSKDMYYCNLRKPSSSGHTFLCLNQVTVGDFPGEPESFDCVSPNWEKLICHWKPKQNYINTQYSLAFNVVGRGVKVLFKCPAAKENIPLAPNTCIWEAGSDPIYRQPYEYYNFYLTARNIFGNATIPYRFDHYANVLPNKPDNLTVISKTSSSAEIYWAVPFPLQQFPPGIHHRIMYQHQWSKNWTIIDIKTKTREPEKRFNITSMYANTVYDVRVVIKSATADQTKWSNFSSITFRTLSALPGKGPRVDVGSFEIVDDGPLKREVYIYWQTIPQILENGNSFKYQIASIKEDGNIINDEIINERPIELTRTYARFDKLNFGEYHIGINATNQIGSHPTTAWITIPSKKNLPMPPESFTKIAFDEGVYELSWKLPTRSDGIINYTIFWCDNDRDRPFLCAGYLDWIHVSNTTTMYNMTVPNPNKIYQFAISSNTANSSSGMIWASCTVIHNRIVGKVKSLWIDRIGSHDIEVRWNLECSDRVGIILGYKIYYCPIKSPFKSECKEPSKNITVLSSQYAMRGIVNNLKPYTTYKLTLSMLTKYGEGLESEPLHNTTLEASPDIPNNLKITNITNTTISLSWSKPVSTNGVLHSYILYYNDNTITLDEKNQTAKLVDLLPYKNYSISITACTVACSEKSPSIYGHTLIGVPGKINHQPNMRYVNETLLFINWSKPTFPNGNNDYYEVLHVNTNEIINSTISELKLTSKICENPRNIGSQKYQIRAININEYGEHLIGPWSDIGETVCYGYLPSIKYHVILSILFISLFIIFCIICIKYARRLWQTCQAMQDVEVKLPPGLQREKLLQKQSDQKHIRHSSPDSSGCSIGHESVTSSLTSDLHGSTDSGTEVDPVLNDSKHNEQQTLAWESNLRQRNVCNNSKSTITGINDAHLKWDSYVKIQKNDDNIDDIQSLARSTPNLNDNSSDFMIPQQAWSSTGYISMPSSQDLSCDSNPSPIPKEFINSSAAYSVVGLLPNATSSKINLHQDDTKTNMPYVSLASFDDKNKQKNIDDNIIQVYNIEQSSPSSSKPYVQAGILDSMKKIDKPKRESLKQLTPSKPTDSCYNKNITSPFLNKKNMDTKPYVTIGDVSDIKKSPNTKFGDKKQSLTTNLSKVNEPYVMASSIYPNLQDIINDPSASSSSSTLAASSTDANDYDDLQKTLTVNYPPISWDDMDDLDHSIEDNIDKSVNKNTAGYVAVSDLPKKNENLKTSDGKATSSYVQHHQLKK